MKKRIKGVQYDVDKLPQRREFRADTLELNTLLVKEDVNPVNEEAPPEGHSDSDE